MFFSTMGVFLELRDNSYQLRLLELSPLLAKRAFDNRRLPQSQRNNPGRSNDTGAALCKNGVVETTVDDHSLTRHELNRNAQKYELHGRYISLKFV